MKESTNTRLYCVKLLFLPYPCVCVTHCLLALELAQHLLLNFAGTAFIDLEELICDSVEHVQVHTAVDVLPPMLVVRGLGDLRGREGECDMSAPGTNCITVPTKPLCGTLKVSTTNDC